MTECLFLHSCAAQYSVIQAWKHWYVRLDLDGVCPCFKTGSGSLVCVSDDQWSCSCCVSPFTTVFTEQLFANLSRVQCTSGKCEAVMEQERELGRLGMRWLPKFKGFYVVQWKKPKWIHFMKIHNWVLCGTRKQNLLQCWSSQYVLGGYAMSVSIICI